MISTRERSLYLSGGMIAGAALAFCWWSLAPVDALAEQDAVTLAHAGPRGAATYEVAVRDGKITRPELQTLREAAGEDIDAYFRNQDTHRR